MDSQWSRHGLTMDSSKRKLTGYLSHNKSFFRYRNVCSYTNYSEDTDVSELAYSGKLTVSQQLGKTFYWMVNYNLFSPMTTIGIEKGGYSFTDVSLKRAFLNKRLWLMCQVYDVFNTRSIRRNNTNPSFESVYSTKNQSRRLLLTAIYRFTFTKNK